MVSHKIKFYLAKIIGALMDIISTTIKLVLFIIVPVINKNTWKIINIALLYLFPFINLVGDNYYTKAPKSFKDWCEFIIAVEFLRAINFVFTFVVDCNLDAK